MPCLVCQPQERGTLLSQRPWRNSPAIALRNAAPVKVFLPRLLPFFLGRCRLIPGIELPVQHGVELLLQAMTDFFFVSIFAPADGTWRGRETDHRGFARFSFCFAPFRDGRNDCDGCFGGIIFTVATVAAVARLICFQHHK